MTTENESEKKLEMIWPPNGSDIIRGVWLNVSINLCFWVLALHSKNFLSKVPFLAIVLGIFNVVFLVICAAKLQLRKSIAHKKHLYDTEWSFGKFFLRFTKSCLLLIIATAIVWGVLVLIGFDKWYALPMSLVFSYVVFEISSGR